MPFPMIMIVVLHEVILMVILLMLLPLIRPIKIAFQDIPNLAEHFSQNFYGMPLLQLCFNIQNAPKAPISAITSSMPKVATRQDYNFVPYARK